MKQIVLVAAMVSLVNSSSINHISDFTMTKSFYDQQNIERQNFSYDSKTGVLKKGSNEVIIPITNEDKKEIYNLYSKGIVKSNDCWYKYEDGNSSKINFIINTPSFRKIKCESTKKPEVEELVMFYFKINKILKSKKQYKEAFPGEFEIL